MKDREKAKERSVPYAPRQVRLTFRYNTIVSCVTGVSVSLQSAAIVAAAAIIVGGRAVVMYPVVGDRDIEPRHTSSEFWAEWRAQATLLRLTPIVTVVVAAADMSVVFGLGHKRTRRQAIDSAKQTPQTHPLYCCRCMA